MTFEEFFAKKRIDLVALEKAEPQLFAEFKSHFSLMGEKSFEHTKKFWFNKLRRAYHLATPEKVAVPAESKIASQAEPLSSPTVEQTIPPVTAAKPAGFRPRSVAAPKPQMPTAETTPVKEEQSAQQETPVVKKPAFKPRNIPSVAKAAEPEAEDAKSLDSRPGTTEKSDTPVVEQKQESSTPKPAFKPRMAVKSKEVDQAAHEELSPDASQKAEIPAKQPKPAYKPKFNLKNIQKANAAPEEVTNAEVNTSKGDKVDPEEVKAEQPTVKSAYKPRFNLKNIPQKKSEDSVELNQDAQENPQERQKDEQAPAPEVNEPTEAAPKPAYKPRFNMKNIQQQKEAVEETKPLEEATGPEKVVTLPESPAASESEEAPLNSPKPAYKPRFNMKNIKPKNPGTEE